MSLQKETLQEALEPILSQKTRKSVTDHELYDYLLSEQTNMGALLELAKSGSSKDLTLLSFSLLKFTEAIAQRSPHDILECVQRYLAKILQEKNADYGNSFSKAIDVFGFPVVLVRVYDKLNRLLNLMGDKKDIQVEDESTSDTLIDLFGYLTLTRYEFIRRGVGSEKVEQ